MYSILNPIEDILARAVLKIKKYDRSKYFLFFSIIEKYISDNKLIISGNFANLLILDNRENIKNEINITYEIYSEEPKTDAIELANLLFNSDKNGLARYVNVFTKIPNKVYNLNINGHICCTFYRLPIFRDIDLNLLLKYRQFNGIYKKDIQLLCMGNYIQLITLYNNINNPNNISNLSKNLINEQKLRELYKEGINKEESNKEGINKEESNKKGEDPTIQVWSIRQEMENRQGSKSKQGGKSKQGDKQGGKQGGKENKDRQGGNICKTIFYEYICNSNYILIGFAGNYLISGNDIQNDVWDSIQNSPLQIITMEDLESEAIKITAFCNKNKIDVTWNINNINYINDNFLKKITIMASINGAKKKILEVFNYGEYNATGYHNLVLEKGITIKFGTIFILMLFNLIEEWINTLLKKDINSINAEYLKLSNIMDKIKITEYLETIEYLGIYKDVELEIKRISFKLKRINNENTVTSYYPLKPSKLKLLSNIDNNIDNNLNVDNNIDNN